MYIVGEDLSGKLETMKKQMGCHEYVTTAVSWALWSSLGIGLPRAESGVFERFVFVFVFLQ